MPKMNPQVRLAVRDATCTRCRMAQQAEGAGICVTAEGHHQANVLVVSKKTLTPKSKTELETYLSRAGFDCSRLAFTGVSKCMVYDITPNKSDFKACKKFLDDEIRFIRPKWILALGSEAMQAVTGKAKITEERGKIITKQLDTGWRYQAMATIAPAMVWRNPGLKPGFEADLKFFHNQVNGLDQSSMMPDESQYIEVLDKGRVRDFIDDLSIAHEMSFDLETSGFDEFADDAAIITLSATLLLPDDELRCYVVPLFHPESPWCKVWRKLFKILTPHLLKPKKVDAHNGKFDCRWMHHFGCKIKQTFDTMLAAHLLDENRPKGLKPLARTLLGVPAWDITIKSQKGIPWYTLHKLSDIMKYNGLDTWYTYKLKQLFAAELIKQPRLLKIFKHLMMPASNEMVLAERKGVWTDREQVATNLQICKTTLAELEEQIKQFIPEDHGFKEINFNPSNFMRWLLFDHLNFPVLGRGKTKDDGSPGAPSLAEQFMTQYQEMNLHPITDLLLKRSGWVKNKQFFEAYLEQIDDDDRIHTTFKITGTVTGRLSSGKADADKVTGVRASAIRGVNLQQVPRDKFVRGVFGAPKGFAFVEADYSQVELRVAAFLSQERNMLHLYATGQDIHTAMAMRMTGKPWHGGDKCGCGGCITNEERKKAKAVNFGFLYGMGWAKFIKTAWSNYGVHVSESEAQMFRKAFFEQFPQLLPWHASQRRFAHKYGYVVSPLGRMRHLPDINSAENDVRAEAERQAINSPVQGFASDMALLSMVRLSRLFRINGLEATPIGAVHDAVNFEVPHNELSTVLPMIKYEMEDPEPLRKLFGVEMNVPIIADIKAGKFWGGSTEIPGEVITDDAQLRMWLRDNSEALRQRKERAS
jgi:uracil-DNA glycosylase family 4